MSPDLPSPAALAVTACGPDCAYAERLPGLDADWLWCGRPAAASCVARADHDCRWFRSRPRPPAPEPVLTD